MRRALESAVRRVVQLTFGNVADQQEVVLDPPRQAEHGDLATNWALVSANSLGKAPQEIAATLAQALASSPEFASAEVAGPGFLNLTVSEDALRGFRAEALGSSRLRVLEDEGHWCRKNARSDAPQRINVEFVSVNPNGPVTIGSARGAAYGSSLCNVLKAVGHSVHREYYINDGANSEQMRLFAESVRASLIGRPPPEGGYRGDYVDAVATVLADLCATGFEGVLPEVQSLANGDGPGALVARRSVAAMRRLAESDLEVAATEDIKVVCEYLMVKAQRSDLSAFGVEFDTWFSEQSLVESGQVTAAVDRLVERGVADDAPFRTVLQMAKGGKVAEVTREPQETVPPGTSPTLWLRSTKLGDDMDRVLRRADGRATYIASDVAYHASKFDRPPSADKVVTVLGPDHHGYIARLRAVVATLAPDPPFGENPEPLAGPDADLYADPAERDQCRHALAWAKGRLEVLIFQLVRFVKDGKPAPMRKRDGNVYAVIDLLREVAVGVARNSGDTRADADIVADPTAMQKARDVVRFFYLARHHDTTFDFDLALAERESEENPVFYVQYAYARVCGILRKAEESGLAPDPTASVPTAEKERALLLRALDVPIEVERTAADGAVNRLATVAQEIARAFHPFYDSCRVIEPDEPETSRSRLATCEAVRVALLALLDILGVSAPEKMERGA